MAKAIVDTHAARRGGEPEATKPAVGGPTPLPTMPPSELPAMTALLAVPSDPELVAGRFDGGETSGPLRRVMPRCPKCDAADLVEAEGRSGACGPWFICGRCQAVFFSTD